MPPVWSWMVLAPSLAMVAASTALVGPVTFFGLVVANLAYGAVGHRHLRSIPAAIAEASGADEGCGVLEIGPGIGPLTQELAKRAGKVVSIELDRALLPVLAETVGGLPNVEIVPGDALRLDLEGLIREKFQGLTPMVCANLPYNITTPVLTKLVDIPSLTALTVLIQKEAAQRLTAPQGSPEIGASPLWLQYRRETERLFDVEPECFLPRPKVDSALVAIERRPAPAGGGGGGGGSRYNDLDDDIPF